jgi:DNA protecting protein DprA
VSLFDGPPVPSTPDEAEVDALLQLFYYRRILDYQALSLCIQHFKPLRRFFEATEVELRGFFSQFMHLRGTVDAWQLADPNKHRAARDYGERLKQQLQGGDFRGELLLASHPAFPERLKRSKLPINWLFCHPQAPANPRSTTVAIIGSRRSTQEQLSAARITANLLVEIGATVITGLASGADEAAHRGASQKLESVIAVLGSGVRQVTPKSRLQEVQTLIAHGGTVLTEVPADYEPNAQAFVLRNRIVSSLADVVVAVSGKYASGTAHTIRFAADAQTPIISIDPAPNSGISQLVLELGGSLLNPATFIAAVENARI